MVKHLLIASLLTIGLAAPAAAQTPLPQPQAPAVAANGQRPAGGAPRAQRLARLAQLGPQGRAQVRAHLKTALGRLRMLRQAGDPTSIRARRQLQRQVRMLRLRRLRHRGK